MYFVDFEAFMHKYCVVHNAGRMLRVSARDSNVVAKVSVLLWRYADFRKVITSDVGVRVDPNQHGLRSGAT
jgi:hypothetical protein